MTSTGTLRWRLPKATSSWVGMFPTWGRTLSTKSWSRTVCSTPPARRLCCTARMPEAIGSWLVAAFVLPHQDVGQSHPEGFAGPLDNWHVHYHLCSSSSGNFSSTTAQECETQGGHWESSYGWMIHAYVMEDNPLGVFHMWNSNVPPLTSADAIRSSSSSIPDGAVALDIENFKHPMARVMLGQTVAWTNMKGCPTPSLPDPAV